MTARVEVADTLVLSRLRDELTRPEVVADVTKQVTAALRRLTDRKPAERQELTRKRAGVAEKVKRLVEAIESGATTSTLLAQLSAREGELAELDAELRALATSPDRRHIEVVPSWVRQHLHSLASVLQEAGPESKLRLSELGASFTATPVYPNKNGARPYLRVEGATDIAKTTFGAHDLLSLRSAP